MKNADMIIRNGRVIDTYNHVDEVRDIAVLNGRIADMSEVDGAKFDVDASGCIVTAGLIDFHSHCAPVISEFSISPEAQCFPTGVTTLVDAGTSGVATYPAFRAMIESQKVRIKAFLNVSPGGLPTVKFHEQVNPKYYDRVRLARLLERNKDQLLGLKIRLSRDIVGELGIEPLIETLKLAEEFGCPIACHTTDAPVSAEELVSYFRAGDVYAHVYHGKGNTILDENGVVKQEVRDAQKRGVVFDAASGKSHYNLKVAQAAVSHGFLADIVSTDITLNNNWKPGNAFSLPAVMSKCMAVGMSLEQVIDRATRAPAAWLGMEEEIGSLSVGTCADIAVHSLVQKPGYVFRDPQGNELAYPTLIKTQMTLRDGEVVYRQIDF